MISPRKIALVFPYFRTHSRHEVLLPPLGIAGLAAQLKNQKFAVHIFDCTFLTFSELAEGLRAFQPEIVGMYSMIGQSQATYRIAAIVRSALPDCWLVAGGPMPTLYPERFLQTFDFVFRGECDLSFPDFCKELFSSGVRRSIEGYRPSGQYAGLAYSLDGSYCLQPQVHYPEAILATFPIADRSAFDHASYQSFWQGSDGSRTTSIMTTYGCPFHCHFCSKPVFGDVFRRRNMDLLMEEIRQIRGMGYDNLWIGDDNFTLHLPYLEEFCIRMAGAGMHWSCLSRSSAMDGARIRLMKDAGCRRVYLGLETGTQRILNLMNKQLRLEEGAEAVNRFHEAGIQVAAFFIVGYPGETVDTIEATFRHALSLPLDEISFTVPFPLPGSRLFDQVSGIDPAKDWREENEVSFVYQSPFDTDWLKERIQATLAAFHEKRRISTPV